MNRPCRYPTAFYLAVSEDHLDYLMRGDVPGCCENRCHPHRIMRLWELAYDLQLTDVW